MTNYVLSGALWTQPTVTWFYSGAARFQSEIAAAFDRWDSMVELDFAPAASAASADIVLRFAPIDGAYNTLGYASYSYFLGSGSITEATIVFDTAEVWIWSSTQGGYVLGSGVGFYELALHEIGHALGLDHASNPAVLMYPDAGGSARDVTAWDIIGAQAIYGAESTTGWGYSYGTYRDWSFGWTIVWDYGWHTDWAWGWVADWSWGWHVDWAWGWHIDWSWGWHIDWAFDWVVVAGRWVRDWSWSWDYGWDSTWDYGWSWRWDYGWDLDWGMGWIAVADLGWSWSWQESWDYAWATGWHWTWYGPPLGA